MTFVSNFETLDPAGELCPTQGPDFRLGLFHAPGASRDARLTAAFDRSRAPASRAVIKRGRRRNVYPATKTFWLEPLDSALVGCRRYHSSADAEATCPNPENGGYHQAITDLGVAPIMRRVDHDGSRESWEKPIYDWPARDDPRWPTHCVCGYIFTEDDPRQEWYEPQYRRTDTGELTTLRRAAPGAMWDAWWMPDAWRGTDGIALMVKLPNGHDWSVDSEANNCTRKGDRTHKCWIRHGDPRTEPVTVDKNGETCAAGAGSIQARDYHGFLRVGELTAG